MPDLTTLPRQTDLPDDLKLLGHLLAALPGEPMVLTELDGFFAGILLSPAPIPPDKWLPVALNGEFGVGDALAHQVEALATKHFAATRTALLARRYEPLFVIDEVSGEVLWEAWAAGFVAGLELNAGAWTEVLAAGGAAAEAASGLLLLGTIADEPDLGGPEFAEISKEAAELIPAWVQQIHDAKEAGEALPQSVPVVPRSAKVGRNDPCPCGSGRKYKKCCGMG